MKHSVLFLSVLFLLFCLVWFTVPSNAQWNNDPTVNTRISGRTVDTIEITPQIISDGSGGTIMMYNSTHSSYEIYVQRVDAQGAKNWGSRGKRIVSSQDLSIEDEDIDRIASDGSGGAIITFANFVAGGDINIHAQRINASGIEQWPLGGVVLSLSTSGQQSPHIISDGAGGAIVVWEDFRNFASYGLDIYAAKINASGSVLWTNVKVCGASGNQDEITLTSDGAGGAIIAWTDPRGGGDDIYAQHVTALGVTQWGANGAVICNSANDQRYPKITSDGAGGAIITWQDPRGSVADIYAQQVTASGVTTWGANGVVVCDAARSQYYPTIISYAGGGAIITWMDYRNSTDFNIYAQRIDALGVGQWEPNGIAICSAPGEQREPRIVDDGSGGAIIMWLDSRVGHKDIYAQRIDASGAGQWTPGGVAIATKNGDDPNKHYPFIAGDGSGGAIIAWNEFRYPSDNGEVYAQNVRADGTLGYPSPQWTKRYNNDAVNKIDGMGFKIPTDAKTMTRNLATDPFGNSYVTGYSDGGASKLDYMTIKYDLNGNVVWAQRYNGTANKVDKAYGLSRHDRLGDIYVTGESEGSSSKADIVTIKYNSDGAQQWIARWNNALINKKDIGFAISADNDGLNVYVTGSTENGSNKLDYITIAYEMSTGTELWSRTYDGGASKNDKAYAITADYYSGGVVVTGESDGGLTKADYATVLYNGDGTQRWAVRYDGLKHKKDYAFAVVAANYIVYVTGASEGNEKYDFTTIAYNPENGSPLWTAHYNNTDANKNDYAYDIAAGEDDYIYVTGASEGVTTKLDYATVKYDGYTGARIWVNRYDGGITKKDIARAIVVNYFDFGNEFGGSEGTGDKIYVTGSSEQGGGRKLDYLTQCIDANTGLTSWTGRYNGTAGKSDIAYDVALRWSDWGTVVVTGASDGGSRTTKSDIVTIHGPVGSALPAPITVPPIYDGESEDEETPASFTLAQNYPNPFNPTTTIEFDLPQQSIVTLKMYNMLGQEVAVLFDREEMDEGSQEVEFNASTLSSGVYFYRLVAEPIATDDETTLGTFTQVKKMLMLK